MNANEIVATMEALHPSRDGKSWTAVCVWCLEAADPHEQHTARRAPDGGDCFRCSYTGPDTFAAYLPVPEVRS